LILVRSIWRAEVTVRPWAPQHEVPFRAVIPVADLAAMLSVEDGFAPIYARAAHEAGLPLSFIDD
jgi:hypothetical protein